MSDLSKYTTLFFDELEVYEDQARGHCYKAYLRQAVLEFLDDETKETAFAVYRSFFDSYRITLEGKSNPFIDLLDVLLSYEERASTLIDKQRDHYVHSVNVFILGLSIYSQNTKFRDAFDAVNLDKSSYPFSYDTKDEEFFYRWGIAALFHDVGYPIEIIGKQISKFINFATEVDSDVKIRSHLEFDNFEEFNSIAEVQPRDEFTRCYAEKFPSSAELDLLKPIDLLAHKLHISLGVDLNVIRTTLNNFIVVMAKSGFIDHGFYSALIVLKWYGYLIQSSNFKPEYFYYPILDSASAILLHNYYKNVILKAPFDKGPLSPQEHPIAYLLILCDELQEWNRTAYGILDKKRNLAEDASLSVTEDHLNMSYIDLDGALPEKFSTEKEATLTKLLDMDALFKDGFSINCEIKKTAGVRQQMFDQGTAIFPRQLLGNLEKLAGAIHDLYNQKQLERHPDQPLAHPNFSDLPDALKYSNLRQARGIEKKLDLMGWVIRPEGFPGTVIKEIPDEVVEFLSKIEHDEWMLERIGYGWVLGEAKDVEKKISPYLVPYDELSEEIKNLDRDTIRNIPILLERIGMAAYIKDERFSATANKPIITRRLPETYKD